jgi:N6-adenosine-specific RNA methylase IME4
MATHRPRLTDDDLALVLAALRARSAMTTGLRRHRIDRLTERLAEGTRGNPKWIHGQYEQTHEDELDLADE